MKRKGSMAIIGGIIVLAVCIVLGYVAMKTLLRPAPMSGTKTTFTNAASDIDRSGTTDESDRQLVQSHVGCTSTLPCWSMVVGKTKDGDNPIYTSDLDMDKDGSITTNDVAQIK